ncbi:MAG: hypothetical protein Q7T18_05100 [Sedimentisphaerales bacterium]|nr:hypothetical protein [Sedimentisphaerales bacterium]
MDMDTITIGLAVALALSEALSLIPGIRSNGIFQMIYNIVRRLAGGQKIGGKKS